MLIDYKSLPILGVTFLILFTFSFFGAISNDYYLTLTGKEKKVKVCRIMLSAITGALVMLGISDIVLEKMDLKFLLLLSYISGIGGFNTFKSLTKIQMASPITTIMKKGGLLEEDGTIGEEENTKEE